MEVAGAPGTGAAPSPPRLPVRAGMGQRPGLLQLRARLRGSESRPHTLWLQPGRSRPEASGAEPHRPHRRRLTPGPGALRARGLFLSCDRTYGAESHACLFSMPFLELLGGGLGGEA